MTRGQFITMVPVLWVGAGLATALWMARRGHRDPLWLFLAVIFGSVLAVMVPERIERAPRLLSAGPQRDPAAGVKVLVGVDGSQESRAVCGLCWICCRAGWAGWSRSRWSTPTPPMTIGAADRR